MNNRVREWRSLRGISQQALAERAGTTQPTIYKVELGHRKLTDHWLSRLAVALDVRPLDLLEGDAEEVMIVGAIDAATWSREAFLPPEQWHAVSAPPDDRHSGVRRIGFEVRAKSADRVYSAGATLVCIPMEAGAFPHLGKRYVVEVSREDGLKCLSVRELLQDDDGRLWLVSLSTDPALSGPILLEDNAPVRLVALVTGSYYQE